MSSIPEPAAAAAMSPPPLALKPREERRLHAGHLWIFSNEVDVEATPLTAFAPGEVVQVRSSADRFLGYAYVNPKTLISARLLSRDPDHPPGRSLLVHRLKVALGLRSDSTPRRSIASSTARATCCPASWSTATATCWSRRPARPASKR
jgi:hypothetical protein